MIPLLQFSPQSDTKMFNNQNYCQRLVNSFLGLFMKGNKFSTFKGQVHNCLTKTNCERLSFLTAEALDSLGNLLFPRTRYVDHLRCSECFRKRLLMTSDRNDYNTLTRILHTGT